MRVPVVNDKGDPNCCFAIESLVGQPEAKDKSFPNTFEIDLDLNTQVEEFVFSSFPVIIQIKIHDRRAVVNPFSDGFPLEGGMEYIAYVSMCYWVNSGNESTFVKLLCLSVSLNSIWLSAKKIIRLSNLVQNRHPETMAPRKGISPDEIAYSLREISENELDGGELSCFNLDSNEDLRLSENDCDKSEEKHQSRHICLCCIVIGSRNNGRRVLTVPAAAIVVAPYEQATKVCPRPSALLVFYTQSPSLARLECNSARFLVQHLDILCIAPSLFPRAIPSTSSKETVLAVRLAFVTCPPVGTPLSIVTSSQSVDVAPRPNNKQ
ncbi:uncharacterized protein TNCV_3149961 [Trichonephila clavipes]|nr:uncharacterized protein TNCV_3149961 [Trichonephila clavipes]